MAEYAERAARSGARQGKPMQARGGPRHESLQRRAAEREAGYAALLNGRGPVQRAERGDRGGLPEELRSGIEALSGESMDGVRVHYNSSQPAQLNSLAYARGRDIHLAPGQEQHLPHEAWHLVQQAQGRVKPTMQMKDGVEVNDDWGLEHEADLMGAKALRAPAQLKPAHAYGCGCAGCATQSAAAPLQAKLGAAGSGVFQLKCKYCGYEKGHAPNCTPESRGEAKEAAQSASAAQHDQSNDNRTRRDQSHPHHGNKNVKKAWK
jgi:hypothetical protein